MRRDTLQRREQTIRQPHLPLPLVPQIGSFARCRMGHVFKGNIPLPRAAFRISVIAGSSKNVLRVLRHPPDL